MSDSESDDSSSSNSRPNSSPECSSYSSSGSSSEGAPAFSNSSVAEWVELMQHPKTRPTVVSCLVYISNAMKASQLNPLRIQISNSDDEITERDSYDKVGEFSLAGNRRIEVFSSEKFAYTHDVIYHFSEFFTSYLSKEYVRKPCSEWRIITRGVQKLFAKPVWSNIERDNDAAESINRLRSFLASGGAKPTRKAAQTLLNAIFSIGHGYHIDHASPLHEAVKYKDLDAVIMLLSHGVDVNSVDSEGFTALHYSIKVDCRTIAKALILFGAKPIIRRTVVERDENEEDGEESDDESEYGEYVEESEEDEEEEEEEDEEEDDEEEYESENEEDEDEGEESEDEVEESDDEEEENEEVEEEVETLTMNHARSDAMKEVIRILIKPPKVPKVEEDAEESEEEEKTHLLSLDGGGMRGLVLTTILAELDHAIPGIVDHCKWIAGTSTGSILALALAHGKSIGECRNLYFKFKDVVFTPSKDGYFNNDVTILEKFLQKTYKNDEGYLTTLEELGEMSGKKVISTTVDKSGERFETHLFKSYKMPDARDKGRDTPDSEVEVKLHEQDPSEIPVWEVARCTGAAPFYFKSYKGYSDGGLTNNNPTPLLLHEWAMYNQAVEKKSKEREDNDYEGENPTKLGAVLSIGTGKTIEKNKTVFEMLPECIQNTITRTERRMTFLGFGWTFKKFLKSVGDSANIGLQFYRQIGKSDGDVVKNSKISTELLRGTFFRFTPDVEEEVSLSTTNNQTLIEMMWTAKVYMRKQVKHIHRLKKVIESE